MPVFGDTTSGISNFSEVIDLVNQTAETLELEYAVMGNFVDRRDIPRGQDRIRIPYQTNQFVAVDHTDGDEISVVQQMGIDTLDLTTSMLQITFRVSDRALRFPAVDLAVMSGDEKAKAQAEALEVRLLALLDDTGTQDLGSSGGATTLADVRKARRLLRTIARADGGPVRGMVVGVINAIQEEAILTDLGVTGAQLGSTNVVPRVIPAVLEPLISISPSLDDSYFGQILRIPFFVSQYIGQTIGSVTAPSIGGIFEADQLLLGVSKEWDTKPYDEVEWDGIIVRSITDYGARLKAFPKRVIQFDTAVS